ncbi:hypothetical protein LSUB1_G006886 [Lachnellula subtilissima]|uniref:Uncharacterized protein n=1 Tax=Lachnellula subtilissima TaxID=602034 RepID=A0A8H8RGV1_9HELO|nr:hypothetical protein LSUB1_G006886 [Lachnellula subtilissima]
MSQTGVNPPPDTLSYAALKRQLISKPGPVLPPPPSSASPPISHAISSLSLHPSLEAALHLLNDDLPSAHFLVRKMQAAPRWEAMMLHGILHRIEGDYENTRAWYRDVQNSEVFRLAWGREDGLDRAMGFVRRVEVLRKERKIKDSQQELKELQGESKREIGVVMEWCEREFGTGRWEDARGVWVQDEKSKGKGSDMVIGGEGWRQF